MPPNTPFTTGHDQISSGMKFGDFANALRRLSGVLQHVESEGTASILEPQLANKLRGLIASFESVTEPQGAGSEILSSSLLSLNEVIRSIGEVSTGEHRYRSEHISKILKSLKDLEEQSKNFFSLSSAAGERELETLSGALQKLIDTIQEKKHFSCAKIVF